MTDSSGLLISWAMLEARRPTAASFSVWSMLASASFLSVMSMLIPTIPTALPSVAKMLCPKA